MRISLLFMAGLFCSDLTFGADYQCLKEVEGKTACVAGEMMLCAKKYDSVSHGFTYERRGVNIAGQPFEISHNSLYKRVAGFTPAKCNDLASAQIKPTLAAAKISRPNAKQTLAVVKPLKPIAKTVKLVAHPTLRQVPRPIKLVAHAKPTSKPIPKPSKLVAKHIVKPIAKNIKLATKSSKLSAKPAKPIANSVKSNDRQQVAVSLLN
jgi:hypothetical protein